MPLRKSKPLTILGKDIPPGKRTLIKVDIARLPTRSQIEIPVIIERGKQDGPCLLLLAGIHGDEVNGVEIVRQIVANKWNKPTRGTVICIPVLNVFGFIHQSRYLPDGRDLNRVFPGTKKGSLASQFAHALTTDIVPHIDYCIDYHTGSSSRFNFSQIRISENDPKALQMAQVFAAPFTLQSGEREKSFREMLVKQNKHVLLFEGGKALDFSKSVTRAGIYGALRVMHHLGMRDFSDILHALPESHPTTLIHDTQWVRAGYAGLYRTMVRAGSLVKKGEVLGTITDPYGSFEKKLRSPVEGYIICTNHAPIVNMGDALFNIGIPRK
jgi:predicted deacylase